MYVSLTFLPLSNFALFAGWYFLQLFQLLNLVPIDSHGFFELSRMLIRKNVNNYVSKDSPIRGHCWFHLLLPAHF